MNNHNNLFSLNKSVNGNPKDCFRFKREFNAVINVSGESKLIRYRPTLVTTDEYDIRDLNNKDDIRKSNFMSLIDAYLHHYNLILVIEKILY